MKNKQTNKQTKTNKKINKNKSEIEKQDQNVGWN